MSIQKPGARKCDAGRPACCAAQRHLARNLLPARLVWRACCACCICVEQQEVQQATEPVYKGRAAAFVRMLDLSCSLKQCCCARVACWVHWTGVYTGDTHQAEGTWKGSVNTSHPEAGVFEARHALKCRGSAQVLLLHDRMHAVRGRQRCVRCSGRGLSIAWACLDRGRALGSSFWCLLGLPVRI